MKKSFNLILSSTLLVTLSACSSPGDSQSDDGNTDDLNDRQEVTQEEVIRETKNVTYTGIVKPAGVSIYSEGTHRLVMEDGKFILLESNTKDLNGYVNEEVKVLGAIRPTTETDAMIMRVEGIELLQPKEEETVEETQTDNTMQQSTDIAERETSTEEPEAETTPETTDANEEVSENTPPVLPSTPEVAEASPAFLGRAKKMASEDFGSSNWSQQYCTAHIGFCIPVHKNWWYKSFGATSTSYWHVEMNSESIENLGDGPIIVVLNGESLQALQIQDGSIHTEGSSVVGYRSWTNGRHFEVRADSSLRSAVEYITVNLQAQE
ncbi:hypothetical protein COU78_06800 [Candidatus Peregrinibacteria bacterium CG10_big_fil_rev_8_21_14_0_10_49_24]|nr:MAG: hypothetical protein COV83_02090 [Candidatus Peregrinibacteria bacterium CG11_big_fil_rev_8_21_14_0_20_49_14]PIR50398.1 MAG: hypothetical protein COU78_06800 [Candidatus Peregrinibacteria bacterium CG10_big_fil_rev_8_21_14_0_10_49_24]PJA67487.1 MAG: hypothetical protein CO157_03590 [Candidatus Peregrinibacteria bacterium CG_4_9_14_3_um_filter_49_12]